MDCLNCNHCQEVHYNGPAAWPGRFICLVDNCNCKDLKLQRDI
jgi:hypothetical protein